MHIKYSQHSQKDQQATAYKQPYKKEAELARESWFQEGLIHLIYVLSTTNETVEMFNGEGSI